VLGACLLKVTENFKLLRRNAPLLVVWCVTLRDAGGEILLNKKMSQSIGDMLGEKNLEEKE